MPYCVRSFIWQVSKQFGGCAYDCRVDGDLFNEPVISDICDSDDYNWESGRRCHTLAGFTIGESGCPLFEKIRGVCQTMSEQRFLWAYLSLVKGRNFPMILPQVRVGIAERRRPDFVAFVPLQFLKYKRYAIELDAAHGEEHADRDALRDSELASEGYEVISLRPNQNKYYPEVQKLLERFYREMAQAETTQWELATEVNVVSTVGGSVITDEDIPF